MRQSSYKHYLITVLLVILAFNSVDHWTLGLVAQNLETDLSLSDTQLGFLSGIAFSVFYALMGLPLARWADSGDRVRLIWVTTALWSVAVALCGAVHNFVQLLLVRIVVAVGEAGCMPAASSLITDYFDRAERARATSRYMLGGPLSLLVGYFAAGWLNQYFGWRITFLLTGAPGVALAVLAWLTLKEPRREKRSALGTLAPAGGPSHSRMMVANASLREVWVYLFRNKTFRHLLISYSVMAFGGYGMGQWLPAFFMREYGMGTGELGTWFTGVYGIGSALGTYWGGELVARYAARNEPLQMKGMAWSYLISGALSATVYLLVPTEYVAFGLISISVICGALCNGPLFAALQTLAPERMRAQAIAVVLLFTNLIGAGLGPLVVGTLSDIMRSHVGEASLGYALFALCPTYVWAAWHLWRASRTVLRDMAAAEPDARHEPDLADNGSRRANAGLT